MKKSLVFAMAMALGVSATAFAANPFSDLPAGHWAYGAVAKLAAAGVVDGYPDGTFKGDKTMTRYEMAQIVAKALAKGAIGADDKLVSEFADELDNLGVRVAKLEKNADNVKITGTVKATYADHSGGAVTGDDAMARLRTDLTFTGEVNDNWHYVAMIRNQQFFTGDNESGDSDTDFQRGYLTGNIGIVDVTAGRYNEFISDGNVLDNRVDAVKASVPFGKTYFKAEYGKVANKSTYGYSKVAAYANALAAGKSEAEAEEAYKKADKSVADKFWLAELGGTWGNWDLAANYMQAENDKALGLNGKDDHIWTAGATYHTGKFYAGGMYLKGDDDTLNNKAYDDDGYVFKMGWAGAKRSEPGSWGLYANYYDQGAPTVLSHTMDGLYDAFGSEGFKGYKVGGNLTVAKNMVASVDYYDLKSKEKDAHARTIWSQMVVTF